MNLLFVVPFIAYATWRREGIAVSSSTLTLSALFGAAFGFVEASVVLYLRAAIGLLPGYGGTLSDVASLSSGIYEQAQILGELPRSLFVIDFVREAATMVMLVSVACIAAQTLRVRAALFLWSFAVWDIFYYASLWTMVGWPASLTTPDILFLIPVPWTSQVWFPLLVSVLSATAVVVTKKRT